MKRCFTIKAFERCRIFKVALCIIDSVIGVILAFKIPEFIDAVRMDYLKDLIFFCFLICAFIFILLLIILLNCIIKDAQDDIAPAPSEDSRA